jgi:FlaA1/EpsC-like NDP-sugar epimerase
MLDRDGVIGTTGPHMRRFFIKADDAVRLILTSIDHSDELQGTVVTRAMKAVQIGDLLELYVRQRGGRWERIEGRPGEREDEYLVGESELPYTRRYLFEGVPHYAISFNRIADEQIGEPLSSAEVDRLSEPEMLSILEAAPAEEELW